MTIKELCELSHKQAVEKGFWGKGYHIIYKSKPTEIIDYDKSERNVSELLMLMVTELGEACEALRHDNPKSEHIPNFSGIEEEMADLMIRIGDFCEAKNIRLEEAIKAKMKFNKTRPYKHGKSF